MECSLTVTRAGVAGRQCECRITHHYTFQYLNIAHGFNSIQFLTATINDIKTIPTVILSDNLYGQEIKEKYQNGWQLKKLV